MQKNYLRNLEYDIIIVTVEDSLVHTKSGNNYPRNIADFMPNYNLWYALKFCGAKEIWITENHNFADYGWNIMPVNFWETKYSFISIWLSQMINIECHKIFSPKGNWIHSFCDTGEDILDCIKKWTNQKKYLFIDKDSGKSKKYIESKGYLHYMTTSEFIEKYNKNPRVYEKK